MRASRREMRLVVSYLVAAGVAGGAYFASDIQTAPLPYLVIAALPVVALLAGPLVHRPRTSAPWLWLAAGQAAFLVGDVIWFSDAMIGNPAFPSAADLAYLAAYPMLGVGLVLFVRARRPTMRLVPLIDALVVGIVGVLLLWLLYLDRYVDALDLPVVNRLVMLAYPIGDVLLVAMAAYLLLAGRNSRRLEPALLLAAFGLKLVGDTTYADPVGAVPLAAQLTGATWLASYILVGLVALMPGMRTLTEPYKASASVSGVWPKLLVGIALAAVPVFAVAQQLLYNDLDTGVIVGAQAVIAGALLVRIREVGASDAASTRRYELASDELLRLGAAIKQTSDAVIIADAKANIEYVNPAFELTSGYKANEAIGRNPRFLQSGEQSAAFYKAMWTTLTGGGPWVADFVNRRKDGSTYVAETVVSPIRDSTGAITGYVGLSHDVTEERRQMEQTAQAARERALIGETLRGIDSRKSPEEIANAVCRQIVRLPDVATAALVFFERDGRAMPYGLVTASGEAPPRRRLPKQRVEQVRQRAAQGPWIEAWEDRPVHPYNGLLKGLGVKAIAYAPVRDGTDMIGYLLISSAAPNAEITLSQSLPALVEFANISGSLLAATVAQRTTATVERQVIELVIEQRALSPVYQPLFDTLTGRIVGYEALTRFDDGVPPDTRFAQAHDVGLGEKLELIAIRAALDGARSVPRDLWLNINVSPAVVMNGGELRRLVLEIDRDIVLEVTEHSAITDYQAFKRAVRDLGARVRLAVDDAGAGFASLRHIIELRPNFVKLDRQVIAGIDADEVRQAMVAGLRHFARNTGCWLIAEGVETEAELETLRELDVRYVQGYLLARPMAAEQVADHARKWSGRNWPSRPDG